MELIIFSVKIIHIIVSILLIIVVLLQPGKSGDLGSIFGGGTSEMMRLLIQREVYKESGVL